MSSPIPCRPIRWVLSDRVNRLTLLAIGLLLLVVADLVLAFAAGIVGAGIGVVFWGLHMGFTQGCSQP